MAMLLGLPPRKDIMETGETSAPAVLGSTIYSRRSVDVGLRHQARASAHWPNHVWALLSSKGKLGRLQKEFW